MEYRFSFANTKQEFPTALVRILLGNDILRLISTKLEIMKAMNGIRSITNYHENLVFALMIELT